MRPEVTAFFDEATSDLAGGGSRRTALLEVRIDDRFAGRAPLSLPLQRLSPASTSSVSG